MTYSDCLVCILTYNNGINLKQTLDTLPRGTGFSCLIIDDGSSDGAVEKYAGDIPVLKHEDNRGIGSSIRDGIDYGRTHGSKVLVVIPGNNKNTLEQAGNLVDPIINGEADFVQGSRYLPGSRRDHTPRFRLIMVKLIAWMMSLLTLRKITDSMEGFRAWRLAIFDDPNIDIHQDWLDRYGLETYLFYKITRGRKYRYKEVPISKLYPQDKKSITNKNGAEYSKIRPGVDWWDILRPIPYLLFRFRR